MIALAGLVGLIAFVAGSFVVGGRIVMLATRTRQLPEATVGASLVFAGGIGTALSILPPLFPGLSMGTSHALYEASSASNHLGYILLLIFVWRVFRPSETWAAALFAVCTLAFLVGGVGMSIDLTLGQTPPGSRAVAGSWFWVSLAARFVGYTWAAIESFRYYAMLKRRLSLGLADSSVVMRFFFWGVCTSAVVCIWTNQAIQQWVPRGHAYLAVSDLVTATLGFVVAGSLWAAFFPRGQRVEDADCIEAMDPIS